VTKPAAKKSPKQKRVKPVQTSEKTVPALQLLFLEVTEKLSEAEMSNPV
jgi:hypothetical protein